MLSAICRYIHKGQKATSELSGAAPDKITQDKTDALPSGIGQSYNEPQVSRSSDFPLDVGSEFILFECHRQFGGSYMKRPREHVLEENSKRALKKLLPSEWIVRDMIPDYGLDMEVTIVEGEEVTNKVLVLQLKATRDLKKHQKLPSYRMETKYLKYYENYRLPVLIFYYIESEDIFYYVFAQRYIKENLSMNTPHWTEQKTVTIGFSPNCRLENIENMKSIAADGYFYIIKVLALKKEYDQLKAERAEAEILIKEIMDALGIKPD